MRKVGIHWFIHDLRLTDNHALANIADEVDELICIYCDMAQFSTQFSHGFQQTEQQGPHKQAFVLSALSDLEHKLSKMGQSLLYLDKNMLSDLNTLINEHQVTHLSYQYTPAPNELELLQSVLDHHPHIKVIKDYSNHLYAPGQLPFSLENMPDTFSPFRRKVEKYAQVTHEQKSIDALPPMPSTITGYSLPLAASNALANEYLGGESSGLARLKQFLWDSDAVANYKETRNGFDGWDFSSRFSAWLAYGCLSPRSIVRELTHYEENRIKNESTYWVFFELLWREFFHWQLSKHRKLFFYKTGVQSKKLSTHYSASAMDDWINGNTGYDIVDACMRQLANTGFMSNRGRQLVASCFVHELGLDWRYGATYFEWALVDFDVASNYGNWQYLAGVGADPRGHRQFNLDKQAQMYDSDGQFRRSWLA